MESPDNPSTNESGYTHYSVDESELEQPPYCDDCRQMVKSWPWEKTHHQAPAAMEQETCPLCKYIFDTLSLKERVQKLFFNELAEFHSWADEEDAHCDMTPLRRPITNLKLHGNFLSEPALLPRRILQLDERDRYVRIHQRKAKENGVYATLSYRWGVETQALVATTGMMKKAAAEKDGPWIKDAELPQALQDAIEFTRKLNIRFLWIDVLCTLQGDPADRKLAASEMLSIYKNAAVCIRPTNIDTANASFLRKKSPSEPLPACVVHITRLGESFMTLKFAIKKSQAWKGIQTFNGSHLRRAWTVAETFASPRQITITSHNELTYYCIQQQTEPAHLNRWAATINDSFTRDHYQGSCGLSWITFHNPHRSKDFLQRQWLNIMSDIQSSDCSNPEDRLAIADSLAQDALWEGEHMYGVWKECALQLLIWDPQFLNIDESTRRLKNTPTWSWTSTTAKSDCHGSPYLKHWHVRFIDWTRGSPAGLRSLSQSVATIKLKGKIVRREDYVKACGPTGLDLSRYNANYSEEWNDSEVDGLFYMLVGQLDYGGHGNMLAAASSGTTTKAKPEEIVMTLGEKGNGAADKAPGKDQEAAGGPSQEQDGPGDTSTAKQSIAPPSSQQANSSVSKTKSKSTVFSTWAETVPRGFSTSKQRVLSLMQKIPQAASRSDQSHVLQAGEHTKMMVLKRVSHKTYERAALVVRACEENWVPYWAGVRMEEIHLV